MTDTRSSPGSEGLDPCPVCRSRLVGLFERQEGLFVVSCENDDDHFSIEVHGATAKDAVRQWNTRAAAQASATYTEICMNEKCPRGGLPVEIVRASPPSPVAGEWQPIETAPKDETRILLFQRGRGSFEGWWKLDWPTSEYWMDDADSEPEPTHWRPLLPEPLSSMSSTDRGSDV